jgi:hypothetical protein
MHRRLTPPEHSQLSKQSAYRDVIRFLLSCGAKTFGAKYIPITSFAFGRSRGKCQLVKRVFSLLAH